MNLFGESKHNTESITPAGWMAIALAATGKHVYGGTVPDSVVAKRRAKNKAARKSRRINRHNQGVNR